MDTMRDEALLARFAAAYRGRHDPADALRWLDDPTAPGGDGSPGPGTRLRTLREAVFRPGADAGAAEALRQEEAAVEAERTLAAEALRLASTPPAPARSPVASPATAPRPDADRPRRSRVRLPLAALLVGLVTGGLVGGAIGATGRTPAAVPSASSATPSSRELVLRGVLESDGALTARDYYRLYPDNLPLAWGGAFTGVDFGDLRGETYRSIEPGALSTEMLVVVTCSAAERGYRWRLFTADAVLASGGGACGTLDPHLVVLGDRHASAIALRVDTIRPGGYGVAVFER